MVQPTTWNRIGLGIAVIKVSTQAADLLLSRLRSESGSQTAFEETADRKAVKVDELYDIIAVEYFCTAITLLAFGTRGTVGNHAMGTVILCSMPSAALNAWMQWKWKDGRRYVYLHG